MNNKGFTLVELLAVIVIMSILGVIAYSSVTSYIKTSKIKAEVKFLDEISTEIESYLGLYGMSGFVKDTSMNGGNPYTISKTISSGSSPYNVDVWKMKQSDNTSFTLQDLINDLQTTDKFQNPRTEKVCVASNIPINVYKDSDYVYYYYVEMTKENIGCTTLSDIDTRPDDLRCELGITEACPSEE